ncbi:hypothetical protein D3C85_853060 [compost metagenome]
MGVDAVGHHFTVGQALHAGLIQGAGGAAVKMHAAVPETVSTQWVEARFRPGHVGQLHQRVAFVLERMAPVFQRLQCFTLWFWRWGCLSRPWLGGSNGGL